MKSIHQSFSVPFTYEVIFTHHLFELSNPVFIDVINNLSHGRKANVYMVIDQGVADAHEKLIPSIQKYFAHFSDSLNLLAEPLIVSGGEQSKNDASLVECILEAVDNYKIDRHSYIVAIGGGAVIDMVGYAASIAHRGVRHIRIPSTVLSQNDSGVGVKNSINKFGKKNFIGNFAPPHAVINDLELLSTLDIRDWRAGMAEAVKVALIKDAEFFSFLEKNAVALANRDLEAMEQLIYRCAELHMDHIASGDPFEMGSSRPLDFGHWSAHKLEQLTNYGLRHGEAVAIGMALDVSYSAILGILDETAQARILNLLYALGFDLFVGELKHHSQDIHHPHSVLGGLEEFREHLGGELTIMLLDKIGHGIEVHEINLELMQKAILFLEQIHLQYAAGSLQ